MGTVITIRDGNLIRHHLSLTHPHLSLWQFLYVGGCSDGRLKCGGVMRHRAGGYKDGWRNAKRQEDHNVNGRGRVEIKRKTSRRQSARERVAEMGWLGLSESSQDGQGAKGCQQSRTQPFPPSIRLPQTYICFHPTCIEQHIQSSSDWEQR